MAAGFLSMAHPAITLSGIAGNIISFLVFLAPHDVPAGVPQEVDRRVQLGSIRGGALQLGAVDLLRAGEDELATAADHQRLRLRRGGRVHRLLPGVRAEEGQGPHHRLLPAAGRGGVRGDRAGHAEARRPGAPREVPRQRLPRLLHGRVRRAAQHHREGREDEERRVPAHQPVLLPHPQRRRVVLLRALHQGPVRHVPECRWLLLQLHPDGALLLVPQAAEHHRRAADHHRRRRDPEPGDRAPRRAHRGHPVREPRRHPRRAQGRRGGPAAGGRHRRRSHRELQGGGDRRRRHHQQAGGHRDRGRHVTFLDRNRPTVARGWTEQRSSFLFFKKKIGRRLLVG